MNVTAPLSIPFYKGLSLIVELTPISRTPT